MQHRIELITGSGDGGGATEGNNKLRGSPSTTLSTLNAASLTKGVRNLTISTLLVNETSRFVTRDGPYNYQVELIIRSSVKVRSQLPRDRSAS